MNAPIVIAPVRKSVRVKAPVARAFDVFTSGLSRWWPLDHGVGGATSIVGKDFLPAIAPRTRCRAGPWAFCKLRDDGIVPLICPSSQNVFAGSLKASMPAATMLLCMGLFSIF